MKYITIFIGILSLSFGECLEKSIPRFTCGEHSKDWRCRFEANTPYNFLANYNDSKLEFPGCTAQKLWLYVRDGMQFMADDDLLKYLFTSLKNRTIASCNKACHLYPSYNITSLLENYNPEEELKQMQVLEENDIKQLAERFQSRFPELMPKNGTSDVYKFVSGNNRNIQHTATTFIKSLIRPSNTEKLYEVPEAGDPRVSFSNQCTRWIGDILNNDKAYKEVLEFMESQVEKFLLGMFSYSVGHHVGSESARDLRDMCLIQTALNNTRMDVVDWCEFQRRDCLEVIEYEADLNAYWIHGYGNDVNFLQSCGVLKDMIDMFSSPEDQVKTSAYFVDSGAMLKVLTLLGIGKDEDKFTSLGWSTTKNRRWRQSLINGLASNIAFVLYDCGSMGQSILTMHQERIVNLPNCPAGRPCPMNIFERTYPVTDDTCKLQQICSEEEA